ncbi:MAG TPA: SAM-dependent chlorinase/fluorinase [Vicinamibacterales bacterium]|nr:SAM-dependent chlorinase/fluorinase [Vicinamibacterales bacterium]
MPRPVVALLTDFGSHDHYAGTMKAVILGICPDVTLVDITHDIPPHDVLTAALELAASYKYFPTGAIFLVVVDPGVGSARRGIVADTGDHRFVAPDNGVLSAVFKDSPPRRVFEMTERRYVRPTVSRTFEGRDRFAPAAAWLAKGVDLSTFGRSAGVLHQLNIPTPTVTDDELAGEVLRVDRFGNLVTNIDRKLFDQFVHSSGIEITAATHRIGRVIGTYAEAAADEVCALFGSTDHLEVAVNAGSARDRLNLTRGAPVTIRRV